MQLEIWSDVACPWCAIGKRRLEAALSRFGDREEVEVRWRSFELDPSAPPVVEGDYATRLAAKYGTDRAGAQEMIDRMVATAAEDGWTFRFDRVRPGNTFDAHRLLHLAAEHGIQDPVKERFLRGYLEEGAAIGDRAALAQLAGEAGLRSDEVAVVLGGDAYAAEVRADQAQAQAFGIQGVPFFVIDRRFAVSGAQPAATLVRALEQARAERRPLTSAGSPHAHGAGEACSDGRCAV